MSRFFVTAVVTVLNHGILTFEIHQTPGNHSQVESGHYDQGIKKTRPRSTIWIINHVSTYGLTAIASNRTRLHLLDRLPCTQNAVIVTEILVYLW